MLMLVFNIADNLYAIDSARVVEVIPRISYRAVHHVPAHIVGVFNYRGAIVPVIDLCKLIRGQSSRDFLSTRVMMVGNQQPDGSHRYIGLMAERVIETLNVQPNDFKQTGVHSDHAAYLGRIITEKRGMIQQITLEELFNDIQQLNLMAVEV
jgi:chemotaxis-related protein WspB